MEELVCRITDEPIKADEILRDFGTYEHGAQVYFLGLVRNHNHGKKVLAVSYDIFAPLAVKVLRQICEEARDRFEGRAKMIVVHREGKLKVGDVSVCIAVSTPHREEAYQISRYIIEELKVRAPIWKKEHYETGETDWLQGHALCGKEGSR
ncbi:MAG: molybdenum cofactor biosynthesis protein MoaE [Deltaproteobacteria bacterium]|nr:molybdenum cofactor biosynthesis protein MoaE [Deltaproteobacteria bacterium]